MHDSFSEDRTKRELIEPKLVAAGWHPIVDYNPGVNYDTCSVREYQTSNGPADYILFHQGVAVADVEAKRAGVGPQNVLSQDQRYVRGFREGNFQFGEFRLPFIYSTNGYEIWFQDLRDPKSRSRIVSRFHTPSALNEFLSQNREKSLEKLKTIPTDIGGLRTYQKEAVAATETALPTKRRMLIAMATGTGKTHVAIALAYRLMKAGLAKRVLFLVDRRALAAQAVGAFSTFEPEPGLKFNKIYEVYSQKLRREDIGEEFKFEPNVLPRDYLTDPQPQHTFLYICTIQRMRINLFGMEGMFSETPNESETEEDAQKLDIPIHAFDLIIADECHRGYTSTEEGKWREVLNHFDAVTIGLTATPAAHTKAYFGDSVYRYEYERAVREGVLVDYDPVRIESGITMKGLFLKENEPIELQDRTTGQITYDQLEDERAYDTADLEEKATAPDRNRKIVKEFLKYALEQEKETGRFPKTLVFAINDLQFTSHSDQLVNIFRDELDRGDEFVQKITGNPNVDRPLQQIRKFRNRPIPGVVVTVDMLTTGVDIPKLENILFIRPVKSRILFDQMLGRGTRKCDDINKTHFSVFDAVGVLDYFAKASDFTADPPAKPTKRVKDIIEAIHNNQDAAYNTRVLVRRLQRIAKDVSAEGRQQFAKFIPNADISGFAASLPNRLELDWTATMKLLRDPALQKLLEDYPRSYQPFVIAPSVEDQVTSARMFKTVNGRSMKPEDYLIAFERFIRENPEHVDALRILLGRPSDFDTKQLAELRQKLSDQPEQFTEEKLRRAYHKELADIISIIRHAARGDPLLSAQERVDKAMAHVMEGKTFTTVEQGWLQLIRAHLVNNILIEEPDFSLIPFSRHGGWTIANQVFEGKLAPLLREINLAMVTEE
ncbi:MAG: type I restriction-modification enzyme R subunit C-terminal domain-containing protein [Candidatus Bathyarchaeia archaeon]